MWRSVLFFVFTTFIILLSSCCLFSDKQVNRNTNESVQVNPNLPSGGDLIEIDAYEFAKEGLTADIKKISQELGLFPFPKTARTEELEFRLWTELGGLGDAKLLTVRSSGNMNNAYFFDIGSALNPTRFRKKPLAKPKSGWNRMLFEVRSRLTTPKGLVRDPQFSLSRDEPVILLEVLDKGEYRQVFYEQYTSFQDGKKLIELCDYLSSEFGVDMDCHGDRCQHAK